MAAPFRGFLTSHNGSSVNFLGDGTIFWGDGTRIQAFSEAADMAIPRARVLLVVLFVCQSCWAQKPEYDFYPEFRNVFAPKCYLSNPGSSLKDVVAGYTAELKAKAIDPKEIGRREHLILEIRPETPVSG